MNTEPAIIELYHCFVPKNADGTVVLVVIEQDQCIPVFTRLALLHQTMRELDFPFERVGQITDERHFMLAVPSAIKVVVDLHRRDNGKLGYRELQRD